MERTACYCKIYFGRVLCCLLSAHAQGDVDDLALLVNFNERTLLEELQIRYSRDIIYVRGACSRKRK